MQQTAQAHFRDVRQGHEALTNLQLMTTKGNRQGLIIAVMAGRPE